jgi:hypothetical protein
MMIELTPEQQRQLDEAGNQSVNISDPRSRREYVLVPVDQYEQMLEVVEDDLDQRSLRRAGARTLGRRLTDETA